MAGKKIKPKKAAKKVDLTKLKPAEVLCPICRAILIEPVSLPCDHVFCRSCFEGTMQNANLVCPLCRLRVGSWFRNAKKDGKVINEELWKAIQQQYPSEIKNKKQGIDNDIEKDKPVIIVATPGEIRKEYERERQRTLEEQQRMKKAEEEASTAFIKKIKDEEEYKRQIEEETLRLDALLARKLSEELSAPSTSKNHPRKLIKTDRNRRYGPLDKFITTDELTLSHILWQKRANTSNMYESMSIKRPNPTSHEYLNKKYTCHVLPVERNRVRVNRSSHIFGGKGLKPMLQNFSNFFNSNTITSTEFIKRKSTSCKSNASGDNSDVIDREYSQYFKPIDTMRRFHVAGKVPIKVPPILAVNDGNIEIGPPSGTVFDLTTELSAFAKYTPSEEPEKRPPTVLKIESESAPSTPTSSVRNLKRKIFRNNAEGPSRKKGRKRLFALKKNLLSKFNSGSDDSPFLGFDNRVMDDSPFYGFDTLTIEHSMRTRNNLTEYLCKHGVIPDENQILSKDVRKKQLINKKVPAKVQRLIRSRSVSSARVMENKFNDLHSSSRWRKIDKKISDLNQNVPKRNQPQENVNNVLRVKSRSARILKKALRDKSAPSLKLASKKSEPKEILVGKIANKECTEYLTINKNISPAFGTKVEDIKSGSFVTDGNFIQTKLAHLKGERSTNEPNSDTNLCFPLQSGAKEIVNGDISPVIGKSCLDKYMNGNVLPEDPNKQSSSGKILMGKFMPSDIFESDSEDEMLSKVINNICNPTEPTIPCTPSPVNINISRTVNELISLKKEDNSARRTTRNSYKAIPDQMAVELTDNLEIDASNKKKKVTESSRAKTSPTKSKNSPIKVKSIFKKEKGKKDKTKQKSRQNSAEEKEKRKKQEDADFEYAKKLQAQFDLIQMTSTTRRGTKRQITLDEMLTT